MSESLLERSLMLAPVWQLGRRVRELVIRERDVFGQIARADRAPLGELELDVLSWVLARWWAAGCRSDGRTGFTLRELRQALYGQRVRGGRANVELREAVENLKAAVITITGVNVLDGSRASYSRVNLLDALVVCEQLELIADGEQTSDVAGGLRGVTIEVEIAGWLTRQLLAQGGVRLDWDIQRQLGGIAKRLWIWCEAGAVTFSDEDAGGETRAALVLDDQLARQLQITARRPRDRRRSVLEAIDRMTAVDPRYARGPVTQPHGSDWQVTITRRDDAR